jgi:hypothetical protein
MEYIMQKK